MTVAEVVPNSCRATCGSITSANGDVITLLPVPAAPVMNVLRMNVRSATFVCLLPGADTTSTISASPTQASSTLTTLPSPSSPKSLSLTKTIQSSKKITSVSTTPSTPSSGNTSISAPLLTMSALTSTAATHTSLTTTTQPTLTTKTSALSSFTSIASSSATSSTASGTPTTLSTISTSTNPLTPTTPTKSCAESWSYYDGWCYAYFRDPVNFATALWTCRTIAGLEADLVSIHSAAENAFVYDLWVSLEEYIGAFLWIGYHKPTNAPLEQPFVWTDGSPDDYDLWGPTQPDNIGGIENCVSFWGAEGDPVKLWHDVPCDTIAAPFVCKAAI
ncbi:aggrecan core protein-like [Lytechinus variegatus]|uniref:aggrecan core protein-like n=1 Tax=Lytechinus variegatus TaxID=7654 RepID=UPI001BB1E3A2|nr:aggrecan core protein-like [Lytechinus variegatus]